MATFVLLAVLIGSYMEQQHIKIAVLNAQLQEARQQAEAGEKVIDIRIEAPLKQQDATDRFVCSIEVLSFYYALEQVENPAGIRKPGAYGERGPFQITEAFWIDGCK